MFYPLYGKLKNSRAGQRNFQMENKEKLIIMHWFLFTKTSILNLSDNFQLQFNTVVPYFKENLVSFQAALPDLIAKKTTGINTTNNIAYFIYFSYLILINFNENRCVIPLQDNYTDSNFCLMLMPNRNTSKIKKSDPKASLS